MLTPLEQNSIVSQFLPKTLVENFYSDSHLFFIWYRISIKERIWRVLPMMPKKMIERLFCLKVHEFPSEEKSHMDSSLCPRFLSSHLFILLGSRLRNNIRKVHGPSKWSTIVPFSDPFSATQCNGVVWLEADLKIQVFHFMMFPHFLQNCWSSKFLFESSSTSF